MRKDKIVACYVCETEHYAVEVLKNIKDGIYTCPNCKTKTNINKNGK